MATTIANERLRALVANGRTTVVHPGRVDYTEFVYQEAVGTEMHGKNSVVVIVSPLACIMVQITGISPSSWPDTSATLAEARSLMADVAHIREANLGKLDGAQAYVIFAHSHGLMMAPTHVDHIKQSLVGMGLSFDALGYDIESCLPAAATVVVTAAGGGVPAVYLGDGKVN